MTQKAGPARSTYVHRKQLKYGERGAESVGLQSSGSVEPRSRRPETYYGVSEHVAHALYSVLVVLESLVERPHGPAHQRVACALDDALHLGGLALPQHHREPLKVVVRLCRLQPAADRGLPRVDRQSSPSRTPVPFWRCVGAGR